MLPTMYNAGFFYLFMLDLALVSCLLSLLAANFVLALCNRFTREQVLHLDKNKQWSRALDGSDYLPGMVWSRYHRLILEMSSISLLVPILSFLHGN